MDLELGAKIVGVIIGSGVGSGLAAWKFMNLRLRSAYRKKVKEREGDMDDSNSDPGEGTASATSPDDTGEFLVRVMEPEIRRQHQKYGTRLADLASRFEDHMAKAEPALRELVELSIRVSNLEDRRDEDKREIIAAINSHGTMMDTRFGRIEDFLRKGK